MSIVEIYSGFSNITNISNTNTPLNLTHTKDCCDMLEIGLFTLHNDKNTRIKMYETLLNKGNLMALDMILYSKDIQSEILEHHNIMSYVFQMLRNKRHNTEYKIIEKYLEKKYTNYLLKTNQTKKLLSCPFVHNKEIIDIIATSDVIFDSNEHLLKFVSAEMLNITLVQKTNPELYKKVADKISQSTKIENSCVYTVTIVENCDILTTYEIIDIIKDLKYKHPIVVYNILTKPISLEYLEKLLLHTNGIFTSSKIISSMNSLNTDTLNIICKKFGTKILTNTLILHVSTLIKQKKNLGNYLNIILWLQHVYEEFGHLTWKEFDELNYVEPYVESYVEHINKTTKEELIDVDLTELQLYFSAMDIEQIGQFTQTNSNSSNLIPKLINDDIEPLLISIIKVIDVSHQHTLTPNTINKYKLVPYLHDDISIQYVKFITSKMARNVLPEKILKSEFEFDEDVYLLGILAKYKKNDIGEVVINLIKNVNSKTKLFAEIKANFNKYEFEFVKRLCENVPEIILILYDTYVNNLTNALKKVGCVVTISENLNIDYIVLLQKIYDVKDNDFVCKICKHGMCSSCYSCYSSMQIKKCPFC